LSPKLTQSLRVRTLPNTKYHGVYWCLTISSTVLPLNVIEDSIGRDVSATDWLNLVLLMQRR